MLKELVSSRLASFGLKPATLENGMGGRVLMFVKIGDTVKVDTRTKEYVERVR